jgi:hypothetical protein
MNGYNGCLSLGALEINETAFHALFIILTCDFAACTNKIILLTS